jgi:hypothetical protein
VPSTRPRQTWDEALKPRLRGPGQPKTKIDVVYGDTRGKVEGKVEPIAQAFRAMGAHGGGCRAALRHLCVAGPLHDRNGELWLSERAVPRVRKLGICYELAADFGEFYRTYGDRPSRSATQKPRTR